MNGSSAASPQTPPRDAHPGVFTTAPALRLGEGLCLRLFSWWDALNLEAETLENAQRSPTFRLPGDLCVRIPPCLAQDIGFLKLPTVRSTGWNSEQQGSSVLPMRMRQGK